MNWFDIEFDEPFSQIDVLVDDDVFPRLADGKESSDDIMGDEEAEDETENEDTKDGDVSDEVG